MTLQEQVEAYNKANEAFDKADELKNIQLNVRNGGYNEISLLNLLGDIQECLEGFDDLIESFEMLKASVNDVHSKRLDSFMEKAISVIMGVYEEYEKAYSSSDKKELKKIEAWLDEQNAPDKYLEENGHTEW